MAVSRLKLANPQPLVALQYHKFQHAFMEARRLRLCAGGHEWSYLSSGDTCPACARPGARAFDSLLLRAGRRGGKTRIGALSLIEEIAPPNRLWWGCAPSYPKLNDYVLPAFFKQIPSAWLTHRDTNWSEVELTLTLPNRSQAQFRSLEDPDRGRGPGLDGAWLDEICELSLLHWETLSPALADRGGILIATTSPKGPDWVHETFYLPAEGQQPGFWACAFTTLDNPSIRPEFVARERARMTPLMFRQEFLAEIVTFTGAIYGELVDPCIIDGTDEEMRYYFPEWPSLDTTRDDVGGYDPGTDHPFAGLELVTSPHGLVATGEYLGKELSYATHAMHLRALRRGFTGRIGIDRSQAQAQIELLQHGLATVPAENDVVSGINRVASWLMASRPLVQITDLSAKRQMPHGLVLPKRFVPKLIKQLQAYRWAESTLTRTGGSRELVYKVNDDLCDALRYALMTYPQLPDVHPTTSNGMARDLKGLPNDVRLQIERERRHDRAQAGEDDGLVAMDDDLVPLTGMGDFAL